MDLAGSSSKGGKGSAGCAEARREGRRAERQKLAPRAVPLNICRMWRLEIIFQKRVRPLGRDS